MCSGRIVDVDINSSLAELSILFIPEVLLKLYLINNKTLLNLISRIKSIIEGTVLSNKFCMFISLFIPVISDSLGKRDGLYFLMA